MYIYIYIYTQRLRKLWVLDQLCERGHETPRRNKDQETNEGHGEREEWGRRDRMKERGWEKKVRESINHIYAPVRVASGTKRNHMQLDNIPRPPASRTGSQQTSPPTCPGHPITPCTLTLDPEEISPLDTSPASCYYYYYYYYYSYYYYYLVQVTFKWCVYEAENLRRWACHAVHVCV